MFIGQPAVMGNDAGAWSAEAALLRNGFGVVCRLGVQAELDVYEENVR
ncbi:hypothetical protein [Paenibacillus etheri]|nr:hypothetical protein [Paenibacillus etheri]